MDTRAFGDVLGSLIAAAPLNELGPGRPIANDALRSLSVATAFAGKRVVDEDAARCCLSGILLRFDHLNESHALSQDIETADGSYWHGIMHRREPDYGNGKYWFRRVGRHAIFPALAEAAAKAAAKQPLDRPAEFLAAGGEWDPYRFIDLCEAIARGKSQAEALAREVARIEWELLFADCYRRAIGA